MKVMVDGKEESQPREKLQGGFLSGAAICLLFGILLVAIGLTLPFVLVQAVEFGVGI